MANGRLENKTKYIFSRRFLISCALLWSFQSWTGGKNHSVVSRQAEQLVIVVSDNWSGVVAKLYGFEKQQGIWQQQFSFPAVLGQNGMALGEGMQTLTILEAPQKKEGDMKSPAGFFLLGPAFGYENKTEAKWIRMPYIQATDTLVCIDDPHSGSYNEVVKNGSVKIDWSSHEEMHRKDNAYRWGLFVQHNSHPVKPNLGSCIFLHIWEGAGQGTAGCTALDEKNMLTMLHWIRADQHPALIQFPLAVYNKIRKEYLLPEL